MLKRSFKIFFLTLLLISCKKEKTVTVPDWKITEEFYINALENAILYADSIRMTGINGEKTKYYFSNLRKEFKKAEPFASYINPEVGHRVNGPALPVFKEDNQKTLSPVGLQKLEESIYEGGVTADEFIRELNITTGMLTVLQKGMKKRNLNPQRFFVATHQQLLRIIAFSISGFDTPVSHLCIDEINVSLDGLAEVYRRSVQSMVQVNKDDLDSQFMNQIEAAKLFVSNNNDFENFDRYRFIREFMNPITRSWVEIRKTIDIWNGSEDFPFNFDAPTFFEDDSFNLKYFTANTNKNPTQIQIELGKKLFFEPKLSANAKMSCASCHIPEKGYADGRVFNVGNKGLELQRNTPTLLNVAFQKNFFWDGRAADLLDQISVVFLNEDEFNTSVHEFSLEILDDSIYKASFEKAFGSVPNNNLNTIKAISSYVSTLNNFDSKFDKNMKGEEDTFTKEEIQGFNLFMGKALCATCHFIPLTNGTVPPFYSETEKEVIGVPETAANTAIDEDYGFYWKFNEATHKGMFKTPGIRNINETAPYMHNGVYQTLEEVINFYNLGGGGGLGFELPHQTLPFDKLDLSDDEQKALVAFMKTLSGSRIVDTY